MNRRFLILMLAGSLLVSLDPADAQTPETVSNASTELSVAIRAVNDVVEAGSPVEVETTFKNESNHRIPYGVSDGLDYTRYDVRDSGGTNPSQGSGVLSSWVKVSAPMTTHLRTRMQESWDHTKP